MGRRRWGYALSLLIILPGIAALIVNSAAGRGALDWGIDFTGGNFFQFQLQQPFEVADVRQIVDRFATGQSVIQKSEQEVFIRTRPLPAGTKQALLDAITARFSGVTVLRSDEVGPKIGRELRNLAIVGVIVGLILQVVYSAVRFTSILAIAAVYLFGGSTIRDFSFGLMVGIFTGGYSSILNACPILVDWHLWSERRTRRPAAVTVSPVPVPPGSRRDKRG